MTDQDSLDSLLPPARDVYAVHKPLYTHSRWYRYLLEQSHVNLERYPECKDHKAITTRWRFMLLYRGWPVRETRLYANNFVNYPTKTPGQVSRCLTIQCPPFFFHFFHFALFLSLNSSSSFDALFCFSLFSQRISISFVLFIQQVEDAGSVLSLATD